MYLTRCKIRLRMLKVHMRCVRFRQHVTDIYIFKFKVYFCGLFNVTSCAAQVFVQTTGVRLLLWIYSACMVCIINISSSTRKKERVRVQHISTLLGGRFLSRLHHRLPFATRPIYGHAKNCTFINKQLTAYKQRHCLLTKQRARARFLFPVCCKLGVRLPTCLKVNQNIHKTANVVCCTCPYSVYIMTQLSSDQATRLSGDSERP